MKFTFDEATELWWSEPGPQGLSWDEAEALARKQDGDCCQAKTHELMYLYEFGSKEIIKPMRQKFFWASNPPAFEPYQRAYVYIGNDVCMDGIRDNDKNNDDMYTVFVKK